MGLFKNHANEPKKSNDTPKKAKNERRVTRGGQKVARVRDTETVRQIRGWRDKRREEGWPDEPE